MKISKLILVSIFLLAVMAMGAASASEDMSSDLVLNASDAQVDDSLAADIDDSILKTEDESNDGLAVDNGGEDVMGYDEDEVNVDIYDGSYLIGGEDEYNSIVYYNSHDKTATGNFTVYVDNVYKYSKTIKTSNYKDGNYHFSITPKDLGITTIGKYTIKATLQGKVLAEETVNVNEYYLALGIFTRYVDYGGNIIFNLARPSDATNKLTLTVNGRTYDVKCDASGYGSLKVSTEGWNLGEYPVVLKYEGDGKYSPDSRQGIVYVNPKVNYISKISVGENQLLTITAPSGENGKAIIHIGKLNDETGDYVDVSTSTISITKGYGSYSLSELSEGEYSFDIEYKLSRYVSDGYAHIDVVKNSPGFSSSISNAAITKGESTTVSLNGPLNGWVKVFVDCVSVNEVKVNDNQLKYVVSGLAVGTHRITVNFEGVDDVFYSKTFTVTVKEPAKAADKISLTLKKVKVKKSAKKLVLKATLKINGKTVKGKKLTFKFNGKTLKAKTNKKGVAKVTVKKKVLKKLKVGKKVKYQVSYQKTTRKLTAKVKK